MLFVLIILSLVACDTTWEAVQTGEPPEDAPTALTSKVAAEEPVNDTPVEPAPLPSVTQLVILGLLVVMVALGNERITELLKKVGLIKDGYAAVWQTVIGAVAFAAIALAKYLGLENQLTDSVNALINFATALAVIIPIFLNSLLAKYFHQLWKGVGFSFSLTNANRKKSTLAVQNAPPTARVG